MKIVRMWEGGPLRQFSEKAEKGAWKYYESPTMTGYTGSYVCEGCQEPCNGVYRVGDVPKWLCAACRETVITGWKRIDSIGTAEQ